MTVKQWLWPKNEAGRVVGWSNSGKELVNRDVPLLNADGGVSLSPTAAPTQAIQTWFGTTAWKAQNSFHAETSGTHSIAAGDGADTSRWAAAITHRFDGSGGASGAPRLDGALWVEAHKRDWNTVHTIGTGEKGPVTSMFVIAANNEYGDTAAIVASANKIYGTSYPTNTDGAALQYEGTTRIYDPADGTTILRRLHCIFGYDFNDNFPSTVVPFPGGNIGYYVEPFTGDCSAAFFAQGGGSVGGGDFVWLLAHSTDRDFSNATFGITGPSHPDGGGRIRAGDGSAAFPAYSFFSDPNTGIASGGSGELLFYGDGTLRAAIGNNGLRVGAAVTTPGAGAINVASHYQIGGNTVINSNRMPVLRSYTVATLPSASGNGAGCVIFVSDGTSNKRMAVSDGTNWRFPDGNIVS